MGHDDEWFDPEAADRYADEYFSRLLDSPEERQHKARKAALRDYYNRQSPSHSTDDGFDAMREEALINGTWKRLGDR